MPVKRASSPEPTFTQICSETDGVVWSSSVSTVRPFSSVVTRVRAAGSTTLGAPPSPAATAVLANFASAVLPDPASAVLGNPASATFANPAHTTANTRRAMERTRIPPIERWRRTLSAAYGAGNEPREVPDMPLRSDRELRALLESTRSIAVLGMKDGPHDDAFRIPRYMQRAGYRILPVSPKLREVLGERAVASLAELSEPVDMIDVFRAPAHVPAHVDEILAMKQRPKSVWLQLGIAHPATANLEAAGIAVVEDLCLMVEHARLFGRAPEH